MALALLGRKKNIGAMDDEAVKVGRSGGTAKCIVDEAMKGGRSGRRVKSIDEAMKGGRFLALQRSP